MEPIKTENLAGKEKWLRALYMALFFIISYVVLFLTYAIAVFQFFSHLLTNKPNQRLFTFSQSLNKYFYQITQFITYQEETKPYPFSDWPSDTKN